MKVVHIVTNDIGGAGRAARRISAALMKYNCKSNVLVMEKYDDKNDDVISLFNSSLRKYEFKVRRKLSYNLKKKQFERERFADVEFGMDLMNHPLVKDADIINLHWVGYGFLSYKGIKQLLANKNVVWTLHDMWPLTAGCYYDGECGKYIYGCKKCGLIDKKYTDKFTNRYNNQKKYIYESPSSVVFVGCSEWITECAAKSKLTSKFEHFTVHNPIDTEIFKPQTDRNRLKTEFGIQPEHKVVLFGAMSADSDVRKGYDLLLRSLEKLKAFNQDVTLIVFGNKNPVNNINGFHAIGVGMICDDEKMSELYSVADVFVAPSRQENLSNAVMESLSCGTPVVAFNIGGMKDMIVHCENGYLATPFDTDDLMGGIAFCLEHPELREKAREYVVQNFNMELIGQKYSEIYGTMCRENARTKESVGCESSIVKK
jgi:glycosyltransferase involved in cell wall biosynthesis